MCRRLSRVVSSTLIVLASAGAARAQFGGRGHGGHAGSGHHSAPGPSYSAAGVGGRSGIHTALAITPGVYPAPIPVPTPAPPPVPTPSPSPAPPPGHGRHGHPSPGPCPWPVPLPVFLPYPYAQPVVYPYPVPVIQPVVVPMAAPPVRLPAEPLINVPGREVRRADRRPSARDAERYDLMMTYGDRLFRADNLARAVERYQQAIEADPSSAAPRIRLAQIALRRKRYAEAAGLIREALTAEPGYLVNAPDLRPLFAEPGDLPRLIGELESHLQADPHDRDAWLALGAEKYLSGRTREAADIFLRLTDRKPDETLATFLDATNAGEKVQK